MMSDRCTDLYVPGLGERESMIKNVALVKVYGLKGLLVIRRTSAMTHAMANTDCVCEIC